MMRPNINLSFCFAFILFIVLNISCNKKKYTVGAIPPNNAFNEMQNKIPDLYDLQQYGFVAYFFVQTEVIDQGSITLEDNFIFRHERNGISLHTLITDVFSVIEWSADGRRILLRVHTGLRDPFIKGIVQAGDNLIISLHDHATQEGEVATGKAIIRFTYQSEGPSTPILEYISPVSMAEFNYNGERPALPPWENCYRFPPHGFVQVGFSDPLQRGYIYFDGTMLEQVPDDIELYSSGGDVFNHSIHSDFLAVTEKGWDIDTIYHVVYLSEVPGLHNDISNLSNDMTMDNELEIVVKQHALQNYTGVPIFKLSVADPEGDGTPDEVPSYSGHYAQDFEPDLSYGPDNYNHMFLTARVRIDEPKFWKSYDNTDDFPDSISGICGETVETIDIHLITDHIYSEDPPNILNSDICDKSSGLPGIFEIPIPEAVRPSTEGTYRLKAVVSASNNGEINDFDMVTVIFDTSVTLPVLEITPPTICKQDSTNINIRITGEPGATINISVSYEDTVIETNTITLPYGYSLLEVQEREYSKTLDISGYDPGEYTVEVSQEDQAGNVSLTIEESIIVNCSPEIISQAPLTGTVGQTYEYDVVCTDYDNYGFWGTEGV